MNINEVYETNGDGLVRVVFYNTAMKVQIEFLDTGNRRFSQASDIRAGRCKDKLRPSLWGVGYTGYGKFRTSSDAGKKWISMIRRCYDKKWKAKKPSYDNVFVCDDWHSLQVFGAWYEDNYPKDGKSYDIDKDKITKNNKIYSAEHCCFISHSENVGLTSKGGFYMNHALGGRIYIKNAKEFCRKYDINRSNLNKVINGKHKHAKGWTYENITSR